MKLAELDRGFESTKIPILFELLSHTFEFRIAHRPKYKYLYIGTTAHWNLGLYNFTHKQNDENFITYHMLV